MKKHICSFKYDKDSIFIKCHKQGVYGINGKYYCYIHKSQMEIEHFHRYH
jgi:hypothetical protein